MTAQFGVLGVEIQEIEGGRKFGFTLDFRNQGGRLETPISKAPCLTV